MTTIPRPVTTPTEFRHPETIAPPRRRWVAWLSVVLLILGLGGGFLVGRATAPDAIAPTLPSDLAGTTVSTMLGDYLTAMNSGDEARIAAFYATDATVTSTVPSDPWVLKGSTNIARAIGSWWDFLGFRMEHPDTAVQKGALVMQSTDTVFGPTMWVYELEGGKVQNQWILMATQK